MKQQIQKIYQTELQAFVNAEVKVGNLLNVKA
jgi:hypothetical protein